MRRAGRSVEHVEEHHELPAVPESVAAARSIVRRIGDVLPQHVREDAALLVSELMSNTVRHGGDTALLTATLRGGRLRVAVHDRGAGLPMMNDREHDVSTPSGRGLLIVDRIAHRWGVERDEIGPGKTVWFQLDAVGTPTSGSEDARYSTHDLRADVSGHDTSAHRRER